MRCDLRALCRHGVLIGALLGAAQTSAQSREQPAARATLVGFAALPADTFAKGPGSGSDDGEGKAISANGRTGPFASQPVQGFSGVQRAFGAAADGAFLFLADNGFGAQKNSADFLLRVYRVRPAFRTRSTKPKTGAGTVTIEGFIELRDPERKLAFPIVNEQTRDRLLTGADLDVESFVVTKNHELFVGDEFGPFVLRFDAQGRLLAPPSKTPALHDRALHPTRFVLAPESAARAAAQPSLAISRGFEGMGHSPDRKRLYPLLEGSVAGDPPRALRIYELDATRGVFTRFVGFYPLDGDHAIGDLAAVSERELLVIERDHEQGPKARVKKIYKLDLEQRDAQGFLAKEELCDLLDIADPHDLDRDGRTTFSFPFHTIESLLVLGPRTLLVANDNNFPFSVGRGPDIDRTEMLLLELPEALAVDPRTLQSP